LPDALVETISWSSIFPATDGRDSEIPIERRDHIMKIGINTALNLLPLRVGKLRVAKAMGFRLIVEIHFSL
jgi:hypothetical protein